MSLVVLVVDDDVVDREAVGRALRAARIDAQVVQAADAQEAFARLEDRKFDLVVSDYRLPGHDGLELLRRIRARADAPPVVMLTGSGDEQLAVEMMRAGAADYLPKAALTPERLESSVRLALRLVEAERQAERARRELARHTAQLRGLAAAAEHTSARLAPAEVLRTFAERAVALFGIRQAVLTFEHDGGALQAVAPGGRVASVPPAELQRVLTQVPADDQLAVSLVGTTGTLQLYGPPDGAFQAADRDVALQLARMVAIALDNARLLSRSNEAARLRDEVMAIVSHDLRNPLQVVAVAATLLGASDRDEKRLSQVRKVQRAVEHANRLIQDLMDVTRLDSGRIPVDLAKTSLQELLEDVVEQERPLAGEQGLQLVFEAQTLPAVLLDRTRIAQVLSNLIGNAIKFTPRGGRITLRARPQDEGVVVSVTDTGPGIATENLPRVFERFWQGDANHRRGAGLGLTIARGIIDSHRGRIWAESEPGRGATFSFWLPAA